MYRFFNTMIGAAFATTLAYLCWDKVEMITGILPDHVLAAGGVLTFLAFVVTSWFVIDSHSPRAL